MSGGSRLLQQRQRVVGHNAKKKAFTKLSKGSSSALISSTRQATLILRRKWNVLFACSTVRLQFLTVSPECNRNPKPSGARRRSTMCRDWHSSTKWTGSAPTSRCRWIAFTKNSAPTPGRSCCRLAGKINSKANSMLLIRGRSFIRTAMSLDRPMR